MQEGLCIAWYNSGPVGSGPWPMLCTIEAPAIGPQFGCHGAVLRASVRCGTAGALCLSLIWHPKRDRTVCCSQVYHYGFAPSVPGLVKALLLFQTGWKDALGEEAHAVSSLLAPPALSFLKSDRVYVQ